MLIIQNDPRVPAGRVAAHLRRRNVSFRILRPDEGESLPRVDELSAFIVLGGYMGVHDTDRYPFLLPLMEFMGEVAERDISLLGICLGGQLLAAALGGAVSARDRGETGMREIALTDAGRLDPLFDGLPDPSPVFQWHNDSFDLPPGAVHLAASPACPGQAFRYRRAYGVQFHPEVDEEIVAAWVKSVAADPVHLEEFAAGRDRFHQVSTRFFDNFLRTAPLHPTP